jgi:hypothetical protein
MEPQVNEFIGLACYLSDRLYREPVPIGVIEKTINIVTDILGQQIEGIGSRFGPHGVVSTIAIKRPQIFFYGNDPVGLHELTSNYFRAQEIGGKREFCTTDEFQQIYPTLCQQAIFPIFDAAVRELLLLWRSEGGLQNLVFCTLSCAQDGGIGQLLADVEIMRLELYDYVRQHHHLRHNRRRVQQHVTLGNIKRAHGALRDKIHALRDASVYSNRLRSVSFGAFGNRLQQRLKAFRPNSFLLKTIEWLADRIARFSELILAGDQESGQLSLTDIQRDIWKELIEELEKIANASASDCRLRGTQATGDQVLALHAYFDRRVERWIRALGNIYDEAYFSRHLMREYPLAGGRNHSVVVDIEDSVQMIRVAIAEATTEEMKILASCRDDIGAIMRNWPIVFDGLLSYTEGDKYFAFFEHPRQAIRALAFCTGHAEELSTSGQWPKRVIVRGAVGSGLIMRLDSHEQTLQVNEKFKLLAQAADLQRPRDQTGSVAFALTRFVDEHGQLEKFCGPAFTYSDISARLLDWPSLIDGLVIEMMS